MTTLTVSLPVQVQDYEGPDSTYFAVPDVVPFFKDGVLNICNYRGSRRSWGAPTCTSDVKQLSDDVIQVDVTGWHKHTVSPVGGSYYFVKTRKGWERKRANAKAVKAALSK